MLALLWEPFCLPETKAAFSSFRFVGPNSIAGIFVCASRCGDDTKGIAKCLFSSKRKSCKIGGNAVGSKLRVDCATQ